MHHYKLCNVNDSTGDRHIFFSFLLLSTHLFRGRNDLNWFCFFRSIYVCMKYAFFGLWTACMRYFVFFSLRFDCLQLIFRCSSRYPFVMESHRDWKINFNSVFLNALTLRLSFYLTTEKKTNTLFVLALFLTMSDLLRNSHFFLRTLYPFLSDFACQCAFVDSTLFCY